METIYWIYIGLIITGIFPGWYWWHHGRHIKTRSVSALTSPPVSVIIAARNASKDLKSNLPTILNQQYPKFEIIVVDDGSDDDTAEWLETMVTEHNTLRVIFYQKSGPGKKEALAHGINESKYEIILVTDADCRPVSKAWISNMAQALGQNHRIVFGYGPYRKIIGFLNKFIRFDTATIAVQYLSAASQGHPYMGVGRNMIYHKDVFTDNGGFDDHKDIASGDDDLFIQGLPDQMATSICISGESLVYSEPKKTWIDFIGQKSRHISTSVRYKWRDKILLSIYPLLHLAYYILLICLAMVSPYLALGFFIARELILILGLSKNLILLKEQDLIPWIPLIDVIQIPYYIILSLYSIVRKKNKW